MEKKLEKMYLHELLITVKKASHATDLMGPDGKNGILEYGEVEVEGSNEGKCKQSMIIKLLDEPRELHRMGEAGRRWVKEQFDWEQLARQAYATFENIAPEGSPVLVNG